MLLDLVETICGICRIMKTPVASILVVLALGCFVAAQGVAARGTADIHICPPDAPSCVSPIASMSAAAFVCTPSVSPRFHHFIELRSQS
jgi:hypothetical protein